MKRLIFGLAVVVSWMMPAAAEEGACLAVTESGFTVEEGDVSATTVRWHATLENRCKLPYDADLTVRFLDADGEERYSVRGLVVVPMGGSADTGKRVYIPKHQLEGIEKMVVDVEERKRPF